MAASPGDIIANIPTEGDLLNEEKNAKRLSETLKLPFVSLKDFRVDPDLFLSLPVDIMFRYNFIPYREQGSALAIVAADPSDVTMLDELELLLQRPIKICWGQERDTGCPEKVGVQPARSRGGQRRFPNPNREGRHRRGGRRRHLH